MHRKVTLLDLGGVVFQSTGKSNKQIQWKIISELNHKYGYELNIGEDKFSNFLEEYNEITKQYLSGKEFLKSVFDTLEINTELIDLIREDSDIVIVSDNYRENINYISKRYDFQSWAVKQIYSFDYKMEKSNPNLFRRLLEELSEYKKEEIVFIDDSQSKLDSAGKSGIKGILFKNNKQIKEDLKRHNH